MSNDLISRQGIIDELDKIIRIGIKDKDGRHPISVEIFKDFILSQPAQPDQETGQWIIKPHKIMGEAPCCSRCGLFEPINRKFCPNCGVRMKNGGIDYEELRKVESK